MSMRYINPQSVKRGPKQSSIVWKYPKRKTEIQELWEARIAEAEEVKKKWREEFDVDLLQRMYEGDQKPDDWIEDSWFTLNLVFASMKLLKRSVVPRRLDVTGDLERSFVSDVQTIYAMEKILRLRTAVMQYFTKSLKVHKEARTAYLNSKIQFGAFKVGYLNETEPNNKAGQIITQRDGAPVYDDQNIPMLEPSEKVKKEYFFFESVDPECILVDRDCRESVDKTGRWIAHKFFRPLHEILRDSNYTFTEEVSESALEQHERDYLKRNTEYLTPNLAQTARSSDDENVIVVGYEIYDLVRDEMVTIIRGYVHPIKGPGPLPPGVKNHPFAILAPDERRGSFYPIPGIYNWVGPQNEYNILRNLRTIHTKRFNRKYGYKDLEPEQLAEFEQGRDGTMIRSDPDSIWPIQDAPMDPTTLQDLMILKRDFEEISHVGQMQRGQYGAESATEAELVEGRLAGGERDEHEEVMDFIGEGLEKLHLLVEANLTQEGAVSVIGPGGAEWIPFGPEEFYPLSAEILFNVQADAATRENLQVEKAQLLQFIDIIGKNPLIAVMPATMRALTKQFPALRNNEAIIYEIQQIAQFSLTQQMAQGQVTTQSNKTAPPQPASSPGQAQQSNTVGGGSR